MLNPDGVIVGNYRTNLAARDLNRTYKDPKKVCELFSTPIGILNLWCHETFRIFGGVTQCHRARLKRNEGVSIRV